MQIFKEFTLDSAHKLPNVPPGHKCARLHGHTYHVTLIVEGPVGDQTGWVIDYADVSDAFKPIHDQLDHAYLNDIEGLSNSTCENLAIWIWDRINLPGLAQIKIRETCSAGAIYSGEQHAD